MSACHIHSRLVRTLFLRSEKKPMLHTTPITLWSTGNFHQICPWASWCVFSVFDCFCLLMITKPNLHIDQAKEIMVLWAFNVKWEPRWWDLHNQHDCLHFGRVLPLSRWSTSPPFDMKLFRTFSQGRLSIHETNDWHGPQARWRFIWRGIVC